MKSSRTLRTACTIVLCTVLQAALKAPASAAMQRVPAEGRALAAAIASASNGDVLILSSGRHRGPVVIERSIALRGEAGTVIDGGGHGRVVTIAAPDVTVSTLRITGSGLDLSTEDAGIYVTARGKRALVQNNHLADNLIGVYLKGPADAMVRGNTIDGRQDLRMNERGNGVQMWNTPGSQVIGNTIRFGRDGIFVTTSRDNRLVDNDFNALRFAVHYMYTNDSEVSGNRSHGNHIGYALMYSRGLQVVGNLSDGDRDRGVLLNYANQSDIRGNRVVGGATKCVFIYNANGNRIHRNHFEGCDIGVHFTAGSERNEIYANAFIGSRTQVKYVGTRHLEWSRDGRGNYWSDNVAFDLDGDGIGDRAYRPNGLVDHVLWRHPRAKLLLGSPALQLLAWVQAAFPGLHPGGVADSAPLMAPHMASVPVAGPEPQLRSVGRR